MKRSFWTILVVFTAQISWAAITIDVATSTDRSSAASSIKSSSFSTHGSNELLLAFIATDASSSGMTVTGVSGGGLTWALAARANAQSGTAEIWRGFANNQLTSITVTANLSQSVAATMTVVAFIGTDPSGSNGSGAIGAINFHSANPGAASCSLITTRNGSWVFGVGNDWDRAVARTLGPNQSMVHQYLSTVGDTYWVQSLNSPTPLSGTTVTVNDTAPTNDRYNLAIAEIFSAQGTSNGFSISGTISPSNSANGSTVALGQNGTTITTTTADASGSYSFNNLQNGSYTLTPSKNGFNFSPASQTAVINGANVSGINFTATAQTWTISGNTSPATSGIPVALSGTSSANTTTDSSGNYSFNGLGSGSYIVTPSQSGEAFSPASLQVTVNSANSTGNNFTWTSDPDLTISKTHSGNFAQGQTGTTYTITATNVGGAPTSGTVTVTDTLPTGLTAAAMSGTSWNCTLATLTCTRSDSLAAGTSYPAITLTVNVDSNAPASLTNTATVSGGGESNTANDQASDVTSIATTNPTGIKLIQSNVNGNESGTSSMSLSFASSNTQGNFLIVTGSAARPASAISVSDTLGNTYATALGPVTDTTQNVTVYIWYVANCRGGANTVTITPSGTAALEIHVSEWSGLATASLTDQTAYATGTSSVVSSGAATTTANGELIFGYGWVFNTAAAGSGFTPISLVNGDLDEYQIQATAGSVAASFTQTSGTWLALMCTFKPASGGTQSWTISGNISPPTSGIPVSLTGASSASTTTDASGNYAFTGLANGTYTVTPSQSGQVFTPASLQMTLNGANSTGNNFTWSAGTTYTISGSVTPALAGANMSLSGPTTASTLTDVSGNYSFSGLANGAYAVTPSKSGYTFSPSSQSVMVNNANATANFGDQGSVATLAIDAVVFADVQTAATTVTSPAFSTRAGNELVLAFVSADYGTGANTTVTGITGGGLNWVLVKRANARPGTAEIWRAFAGSPLSNATVTATLSQRVVSSVTVVTFTGADVSGTNGSGAIGATNAVSLASGAPSASLTTTRPGSWVFGVGDDYDKPVARTLGANQTMIHEDPSSTGDDYWVQRQNATTPNSGTSVTINDTAPTGDQFNLAIVEVLAGVTGDTTPPTVALISPAPKATVATLQTITANANDNVGVASVQLQLDGSNLGALLTNGPFELVWDSSGTAAGTHTLSAIARDGAGNSASSPIVPINVDHSGNTAVVGSWSAPVTLPAVAVNLVLMKNNKLLFYQDGSTPDMWDYINNTFSNVPTAANLFCSGHAELADGRLLVVGGFGGSSSALGISNAEIFDSATNSWTPVPSMSYARWYPTATTLSDGRILVTGGWQTTEHTNVGIPEIYDPSSNTWTKLSNANNPFETYPFIYLLPDGRLVHVGGSEYATVTETLDLNAQTWTTVDANIVDGSSSKMYLPYKIMKAGTAADSQMTGSAANTAYVIDMSQANPKWQQIPSMAYPRSFMNLTELPDGTVLATGGETDKNGGNIANAVYAAELWDPQTQTWTTMSSMQKPREYHGTALLLPDGRVAVSGMGADFGNVPDQLSAEFFSPPYLFKGPRPTISQAPAQMQYGQSYSIQTPDAASISKVVLIRTGAVTHFFDQNTRYVPVSFSQIQGGLNVAPPANGNAAPPGYYMLFLVNNAGVPSVANFVQVTP